MFSISFSDPPPVLRVDDRQRLARERREEREKQLGMSLSKTLLLRCYFFPPSIMGTSHWANGHFYNSHAVLHAFMSFADGLGDRI